MDLQNSMVSQMMQTQREKSHMFVSSVEWKGGFRGNTKVAGRLLREKGQGREEGRTG